MPDEGNIVLMRERNRNLVIPAWMHNFSDGITAWSWKAGIALLLIAVQLAVVTKRLAITASLSKVLYCMYTRTKLPNHGCMDYISYSSLLEQLRCVESHHYWSLDNELEFFSFSLISSSQDIPLCGQSRDLFHLGSKSKQSLCNGSRLVKRARAWSLFLFFYPC